ncbi:hypothetical protein ABDX87_19575 [Pseudomonas abietaniphila]|uniref:hypothetical protein n=1 Tax=Pseudomonas abietaniphila TaxID=89065 RepID=UPI003216D528
MSRDLPGTGSKSWECGLPDTAEVFGFTTASQQIVGQAGLLRLWQNQKLLLLLFMRDSPDTTKRDFGAG